MNAKKTTRAVGALFLCYFVLWIAPMPSTAGEKTTDKLRVFTGDRLQSFREKCRQQKFADSELKQRLVDREKGANAVVFKAVIKGSIVEVIEVWGVPAGQIEPLLIKSLKGSDGDFKTIKRLIQLPDGN